MLSCFENIVKIKNLCEQNTIGFFVENYVDISTRLLANIANESELTGANLGAQLIEAATNEVTADLQLSNANGYSINNSVYQSVNTCNFTTTYSNWGITIQSYFSGSFGNIYISSVSFLPETDGIFTLVLQDDYGSKNYNCQGVGGSVGTVEVDYQTKSKTVKIYCLDHTKKFALQTCKDNSCGSCAAKSGKYISVKGYDRTNINTQPSGFIASTSIVCDMDSIFCDFVNRNKELFAKAISYKVGIAAYTRLLLSHRMNDSTLNINEENVKLYINTIEGKYRMLMFGSVQAYGNAATNGIIKLIQNSWKNQRNACINCSSQISKATAIF